MIFDFTHKNILITGGARGIGKATAHLFANSGGNVIITYRSGMEEAKALLTSLPKGNHAAFPLDVADPTSIQTFFEAYEKQYTRLDVLINNAGIFTEHKILESAYDDWQTQWEQTLQTNLIGPSNMCWFAARIMKKQGKGKIINISSRGAFRGEPDHPAYGASKAGLNAMSQSLAIALAPHDISVHVLAPGFVSTDMAKAVLDSEEGDRIRQQSPFGRVAEPEEVALLIAVYASEGLEFTSAGIVDINGASYLRS